MKLNRILLFITPILLLVGCGQTEENTPTFQKWHKVELSFSGPESSEQAELNPFTDYRLVVTFTNGSQTIQIPGFYAADGNAAETSAEAGNIWKVRFSPNALGEWSYSASFRQGKNIVISTDPAAGEATAFDGKSGKFNVITSDKGERDLRSKGLLSYVGERYLKFEESGEYYLKGGADSPENFLATEDFDGTYSHNPKKSYVKKWEAHLQDWNEGDPTWQNGKGKGIIGALNYLAGKGMNVVYMLTMNIDGDSKDVWPYTSHTERFRFDCSKLDQWEMVFTHMDSLGLMMHLVLQETENEMILDSGYTDIERKTYIRELVARFAHHPAITWNIGEENGPANFTPYGQNTQQQKDMIQYIKETDPYQHFTVVHTHASRKFRYHGMEPLLGFEYLDGPSMQLGRTKNVHSETIAWLEKSKNAGKQWVVFQDEIGNANSGVVPDVDDVGHDSVRYEALWGNLMAGGGGAEWYFGYKFAHADLNCEDWRTRDDMWDQTRYALEFFHQNLPFWEMETADGLVDAEGAYCFAKEGEIYAVYLNGTGSTNIQLAEGKYTIKWFDPKNGGALQTGSMTETEGGTVSIGNPPSSPENDWVVLLKKA
ncbi:DUF5060 domain-containing protein [Flammeovirgaceae bacterium SG7u.111]|nr:DUF5060 domain-containing protein [Flammeovirgaceae bacterium SG7u.132]WPO37551.1 DUF5060 domain-containing protein [Flammeovirgaceae bacterium SG7u.111]